MHTYEYIVGIDGGGSGTRACIASVDGVELGRGSAGPSALMHGIDKAWAAVLAALDQACISAGIVRPALENMAIGLGLAGVHNKQWAAQFRSSNPGFGNIKVETDAFCTLLGAFGGKPGAIIALGTGSVGEVLLVDGTRREVGGWGFPAGDEASGAWFGLQAVNHIQRVLDGRRPASAFAQALIEACGGDRDSLLIWMGNANQTAYAKLTAIVLEFADRDEVARGLLEAGGKEIADMAMALAKAAHVAGISHTNDELSIALCGGLAPPMRDYIPQPWRTRIVTPQADAVAGALQLIRQVLQE